MIRLRHADGSSKVLDDTKTPFVELCDGDGNLMRVVVKSPHDGGVMVLDSRSPEGARYARMTGLKWSKELKKSER